MKKLTKANTNDNTTPPISCIDPLAPQTPSEPPFVCHTTITNATTGTSTIGAALNFEAIANPDPTPAYNTPRHQPPSTITTPPYTATTVNVVLAGSMAKKWLNWTAWAVNAYRVAAKRPPTAPYRRPPSKNSRKIVRVSSRPISKRPATATPEQAILARSISATVFSESGSNLPNGARLLNSSPVRIPRYSGK